MNIFRWLAGCFTNRGRALSLYRRGMAKAKKHNHQGAIHDYDMVMAIAATPDDVKAMVLYNRALVHVATGEKQKGVTDLGAVLAMDDASVNVKTMARQKLVRMEIHSPEKKTA